MPATPSFAWLYLRAFSKDRVESDRRPHGGRVLNLHSSPAPLPHRGLPFLFVITRLHHGGESASCICCWLLFLALGTVTGRPRLEARGAKEEEEVV